MYFDVDVVGLHLFVIFLFLKTLSIDSFEEKKKLNAKKTTCEGKYVRSPRKFNCNP